MSEQQPNEEELRAALEEQMRKIRVEDVLVQTAVTLVNLAGRRLGLSGDGDTKDLDQARQAIDGTRALLPLLPDEPGQAVRDALSQLQMAFARERAASGAAQEKSAASEQPSAPKDQTSDEAERAKARSKIWTPPGA